VQGALESLPCVEKGSIKVDVPSRTAEFATKPGEKCDIDEVKKAIAAAGSKSGRTFTVAEVQSSPSK
jgi:hypothetical protein